jgi:hypothetical protein
MVYNSVRLIHLPHHKASNLHALSAYHKNMNFIKGTGMGSVLLRTAGGGAGSSYMDMDDYISQTGINPYTRSGVTQSKGMGLPKSFSSKLSKLSIAPPTDRPRKNIVMHM